MIRWWPALIFLVFHSAYAEDRLGRLFFTPAERISLDRLRQNSRPQIGNAQVGSAATEAGELASAPLTVVSVQGYVTRGGGKGTVWVNRRPLHETLPADTGVDRVRVTDGRVHLKLHGAGKEVSLKAGQSYDPVTGKVAEHPYIPEAGEWAAAELEALERP
ncbi:hypothetical protein GALL_397250 [mine drainage metagenome]|uniref:Uncharacterized protein n=1 Tax=mine drainage metagenome TaxID=410659 RepID=A0A1J5QF03_9ZZZZ